MKTLLLLLMVVSLLSAGFDLSTARIIDTVVVHSLSDKDGLSTGHTFDWQLGDIFGLWETDSLLLHLCKNGTFSTVHYVGETRVEESGTWFIDGTYISFTYHRSNPDYLYCITRNWAMDNGRLFIIPSVIGVRIIDIFEPLNRGR